MKKHILFFVIIILLVISNSSKAQSLVVKNESKSSLSLELTIDNYNIKEIIDGDEVFHEIALSSIMIPNDKGKPNLPSVNRFVALPQGAKANVIVESYEKEILKNINIAPSKGIVSEYELTDEHFSKDRNIYSKDELYPNNIVSLTEQMNLRGVDAVGLSIAPVQFNPVSKELIVYKKIKFIVEFEGGNGLFGDDRLRSMYWDPILQHNILNYNNISKIDYAKRMERWIADDAEGAEYLIIIPDNESFREQAQRLADYRSKQGIITEVYSLGDINVNSHEELRNWIIDAYNNWEIAPVAVCLFGDYDTNPSYGISAFTFDFNGYSTYISDRPFADIDNDLLPDIAISRLSASDDEEAKIMVDKQINYEFLNPVTDEKFYESPIMTCAFQMEKWFQISTESVNGYLSSIGKEPYRYTMHYYYGSNYNGEQWSSANNTEQVVNYFGPNGLNYIPATPDELGGFIDYNSDEEYLLNKISQEPGYILLNRDHGWFSIWDCPHLSSYSIPDLTNYGKLPFVLSINCASGAFDQYNCLAEAFMKAENAGGVGVIAATYETHTYTNDSYTWGLWDFFENDFLPDYGTNTENNGDYMPAFANVSAKHFLYQQNFPNTYENTRELTSNLFHAHCDAFLKLYSEVPQEMNIEHDYSYFNESNTFNIKAPVGSTIAISIKEQDEIKTVAIAEGTGSTQSIYIPENIYLECDMYVTVTKTNCLRYEERIIVTTNEAYVTMMDFNLYDDSHEIILNQDCYLDLKLRNIGATDATTINLSLSCNTDIINITDNNNEINGIDINEEVTIEDAFHLDITDDIANGTTITFSLNIEHDGTSHEEKFEVLVNSYNFEIINIYAEEAEGDGNNLIDPNEYAKIKLTIENSGNYKMDNIIANLISNNDYINVISENVELNPLYIGERTDLEFEIFIKWNINPEPVSLTLELNIDNCKIRKDFEKLLGTLAEDFENGTLENLSWTNDAETPWYVDNSESYEGDFSLRSGNIGDNQATEISITIENFNEQNISFYYKVSSEEYWDYLSFYIDGNLMLQADGETGWRYAEFSIPTGTHTYTWEYNKDMFSESGSDCVWIDNIVFPCSSFTFIEETEEDNIKIYPNPARDFVNIIIDDKNIKVKHIKIYNSIGINVISQDFENSVDIKELPAGLYFINIYCDNKTYVKKIYVE